MNFWCDLPQNPCFNGNDRIPLELFRKFFGAVLAIFGFGVLFWLLSLGPFRACWAGPFRVRFGFLGGVGVELGERGICKGKEYHYHSFRNHYLFNSKTIKSCNCNCQKLLKIPDGNYFL